MMNTLSSAAVSAEPLSAPFGVFTAIQSNLTSLPATTHQQPVPNDTVDVERERMLLEHLPTVRYIARRIHERLPQHVELDDLVSAGVVGLIDAFSKFDRASCGGRGAQSRRRSARLRSGSDAHQRSKRSLQMGLELVEYQQLLGDLKGLEIGSLHVERTEDSGDEELAYIPGSPEDDPLFRCLQSEMRERLASAIDDLPEKDRLVLTLYHYED